MYASYKLWKTKTKAKRISLSTAQLLQKKKKKKKKESQQNTTAITVVVPLHMWKDFVF